MVTKTSTTTANSTNAATAKIVRVLRNMNFLKLRDHGNVVVPVRTETHPSPMKQAASNRQPGQSHTRTTVDEAINHELAKARYLMDDLADHVFGHIVSTELAKDILHQFINDGIVQVFEGAAPRYNHDDKVAIDPKSDDVQRAIQQAFEDADEHDCVRPDTDSKGAEPESSSTDSKGKAKQAGTKRKEKQKVKTYSFKWCTFPAEPINEDRLVSFLNEITDHAFAFAKPQLTETHPELRHRFAAPKDKRHAMALSYEPDGEDMRPDFVLLPRDAFLDSFKTVDARYINFTASRLVGEAKNKDLAAGLEQVQRYARGLKRAQPWVHYVLAMTITKDKAIFLRGEGSGTERLELILADGRGCIEFIRILLGLALADEVDLGHNPDVELKGESCMRGVNTPSNVPTTSCATRATDVDSAAISSCDISSSKAFPGSSRTHSGSATYKTRSVTSRVRNTSAASQVLPISSRTPSSKAPPVSSRTRSASAAIKIPNSSRTHEGSATLLQQAITASSTSSKRVHSEIAEGNQEERRTKKRKIVKPAVEKEERMVFYPVRVYGHTCLGILFTSSSIRGRGTTVFCVLDLDDAETRLALKMFWQDLERVTDQDAVMTRLAEHDPHPNVIVPLKTFNAHRKGKTCTTLGGIRGFLDEEIDCLHVENRMLRISMSELKRPVKYFWGLHDFVRGLRGALLGHEFLTSIGILHRDVSENNIVLGVYPWEERGYLIDFDMAILQDAEDPTPISNSSTESDDESSEVSEKSSPKAATPDEKKRVKGLRTGTFPYISFNVLLGARHTHFDDVESFLYVLFLFFFSYAGPLPTSQLEGAHEKGFVQPIGSGRLFHMRNWPKKFADWADGDPQVIAHSKSFHIWNPHGAADLIQSAEIKDCLRNNWPEALHRPIRSLLQSTLKAFRKTMKGGATVGGRTELSHAQFINILDKWLITYSALEQEYSNCPDFKAYARLV
ncbi:hypothetical protein J3R82DRAFT_1463 [Butyriboletus roseoflavus]|nr:hypothetical protein J3R82DRAFT_1463 [Butyriboletus roseoflavus]